MEKRNEEEHLQDINAAKKKVRILDLVLRLISIYVVLQCGSSLSAFVLCHVFILHRWRTLKASSDQLAKRTRNCQMRERDCLRKEGGLLIVLLFILPLIYQWLPLWGCKTVCTLLRAFVCLLGFWRRRSNAWRKETWNIESGMQTWGGNCSGWRWLLVDRAFRGLWSLWVHVLMFTFFFQTDFRGNCGEERDVVLGRAEPSRWVIYMIIVLPSYNGVFRCMDRDHIITETHFIMIRDLRSFHYGDTSPRQKSPLHNVFQYYIAYCNKIIALLLQFYLNTIKICLSTANMPIRDCSFMVLFWVCDQGWDAADGSILWITV